jgi:hypothetical protein
MVLRLTIRREGSPMAEFQKTDRAEVTSGSLKGQEVTVLAASSSLEGFYDCVYHKSTGSGHKRTEVTLGGSQLKLVKPGNGGANG